MNPKLNNDKNIKFPYYGYGGMLTCAKAISLKENAICENYKCKYGSRIWINNTFPNKDQIDSVHSETCPTHGTKLLKVGCGSEVPKYGTKQRKKFIEYFKKLKTNKDV